MPKLDVVTSKTARFAKVVEQAGKPEPYTLWQDPAKDRDFQKALREERLMTVVRQPASTKTDAAAVGYLKKPNALFLVFPKSLKDFKGRRIVGLKYDLLSQPKPKGKPVKVSPPKPSLFRPPRTTITVKRVDAQQPSRELPQTAAAPQPAAVPKPEVPPASTPLPTFHVRAKILHTAEKSLDVQARNQREARQSARRHFESEAADFTSGKREVKIARVSKTKP